MATLKFDQGYWHLINSFPHSNNLSLAVLSKFMHWFTKHTAGKAHFYSLNNVLTMIIGSRSPNSDQIVYLSHWYNTWSLVWIHHFVQQVECRQALVESKFYIQSADVTLKMRPRSSKSNHLFLLFQRNFFASLVKIHPLVREMECRQGSFEIESRHGSFFQSLKSGDRENCVKVNKIF